jgi:hypothetical protein
MILPMPMGGYDIPTGTPEKNDGFRYQCRPGRKKAISPRLIWTVSRITAASAVRDDGETECQQANARPPINPRIAVARMPFFMVPYLYP